MHKNVGQKPEWKRPLERPWHRWDYDIKMALRTRSEGVDSSG
jgi:hypothetical protein